MCVECCVFLFCRQPCPLSSYSFFSLFSSLHPKIKSKSNDSLKSLRSTFFLVLLSRNTSFLWKHIMVHSGKACDMPCHPYFLALSLRFFAYKCNFISWYNLLVSSLYVCLSALKKQTKIYLSFDFFIVTVFVLPIKLLRIKRSILQDPLNNEEDLTPTPLK